jgi:hypothetical protein
MSTRFSFGECEHILLHSRNSELCPRDAVTRMNVAREVITKTVTKSVNEGYIVFCVVKGFGHGYWLLNCGVSLRSLALGTAGPLV